MTNMLRRAVLGRRRVDFLHPLRSLPSVIGKDREGRLRRVSYPVVLTLFSIEEVLKRARGRDRLRREATGRGGAPVVVETQG